MMGSGYGGSILGQTMTVSTAGAKLKSSTRRSRISLIKPSRSGIRRSRLKTLSGKLRRKVPLEKTAGQYQLLSSLFRKMIEPFIPAIIAVVTGAAVLFNKVNHRVTQLDHRVDRLELKLVESFTTKADFASAMERMEDHMIRIEDKLDKLVDKKCNT